MQKLSHTHALLLSHNAACSERVWYTGPSGSATFSYKLQTRQHQIIYKIQAAFFYQSRDLYEAEKCCKLIPTWPSLSRTCVSFLRLFRTTNIRRLFSAKLGSPRAEHRENWSSSKRRVAAVCGFFISLETPSFLLQNLISLMMWERESEKCVSSSARCQTTNFSLQLLIPDIYNTSGKKRLMRAKKLKWKPGDENRRVAMGGTFSIFIVC